jgi:hypothetical protein
MIACSHRRRWPLRTVDAAPACTAPVGTTRGPNYTGPRAATVSGTPTVDRRWNGEVAASDNQLRPLDRQDTREWLNGNQRQPTATPSPELSRRRSRVRVPSLPSLRLPCKQACCVARVGACRAMSGSKRAAPHRRAIQKSPAKRPAAGRSLPCTRPGSVAVSVSDNMTSGVVVRLRCRIGRPFRLMKRRRD